MLGRKLWKFSRQERHKTISFSHEIKHRIAIGPRNYTPGKYLNILKNRCSNKNLYMTVQSSILHSSQWEETAQVPPPDEGINCMWHIQAMAFYSATKINEVMSHSTVWLNLENLILSKKNQAQMPRVLWFHLHKKSKVSKSIETESRCVVAMLGWGTGKWGETFLLMRWKCSGTRQW